MAKTTELSLPASGRPDFQRGSIFFVGTATVILRYAGFTILTDPNFLHAGDHVHLGYGLSAKRLTNPAMEIEELPPLDFCVLSHYHGDHFDHIVEERLQKDLPIITTSGSGRKDLRKRIYRSGCTRDMGRRYRQQKRSRVVISSMPGKHGPARFALTRLCFMCLFVANYKQANRKEPRNQPRY